MTGIDSKHLRFIPIPALIIAILALYLTLKPTVFIAPPSLLPMTNTLLWFYRSPNFFNWLILTPISRILFLSSTLRRQSKAAFLTSSSESVCPLSVFALV